MTHTLPPMMPGYTPRGEFWSYNDAPPEELLAPAKRASLFLFGLGGLGLCFAFLLGANGAGMTDADLAPILEQMRRQPGYTPEMAEMVTPRLARVSFAIFAIVIGLGGLLSVLVGVAARGGQRGWLVVGLIITMLVSAGLALSLLSTLPVAPVQAIFLFGLPLALGVSAVRAVLAALKAVPPLEFDAARRRMTLHGHGAMPPPGGRA